jgi:hypothetical protein
VRGGFAVQLLAHGRLGVVGVRVDYQSDAWTPQFFKRHPMTDLCLD